MGREIGAEGLHAALADHFGRYGVDVAAGDITASAERLSDHPEMMRLSAARRGSSISGSMRLTRSGGVEAVSRLLQSEIG